MFNHPDPTDPVALRADWFDHPDLTDEQRVALDALDDEELQEALDACFKSYEDLYFTVLDNTRNDATDRLLERLGLGEGG